MDKEVKKLEKKIRSLKRQNEWLDERLRKHIRAEHWLRRRMNSYAKDTRRWDESRFYELCLAVLEMM